MSDKLPTQAEANKLLANDQARRGVTPFMPFYVNPPIKEPKR